MLVDQSNSFLNRPINGTLGVERDMPMVLHDAMPNPFLLPPYEIDPLDGIGAVQQDFTNKKVM
jgi:hypothetical protein